MNAESPEVVEERLLVLTPTGSDATDVREVLNQAGFCVTICRGLAEVCHELQNGAGVLLIAEEALSRQELPDLIRCTQIQPAWSDLPIIVLTGRAEIATVTTRMLELFEGSGNVTLLERPFRLNTLVSTLRMALRARRRQYQVRDLLEELRESNAELEHRVAERTARLNSTVKSLESFCYSLSHDLRAPLRAIKGFMNVLQDDHANKLDDEGRRILDRVGKASLRMDSLINDLLTLSRLAQGEVPLLDVRVDRAVEETIENLRPEIVRTAAEIKTESLTETVRANPVIFKQVIENFLSNAFKYTRKGEPPRVRIWAEKNQNVVRVHVKDEGIGIAPQHQHRIFELFQRLHSNEYPGTGVGLAIAKIGAERMGGNVGVISGNDCGSCFWVELSPAA